MRTIRAVLALSAISLPLLSQQMSYPTQIKNKPIIDVREYGAKGDGTTNDRTAIQAAINAASPWQTVHIPHGTYLLGGTGTELLLIDRPIHLVCSGKISVASDVGATTDVIRWTGTATNHSIEGCWITPQSGTPARHGIVFDASTGYHAFWNISSNRVGPFGGRAFKTNYPTGTDGIFNGVIEKNVLFGGISLDRAGDTIAVRDNTFASGVASSAGDTDPAIYVNLVSGANALEISHNSIVDCGGGIVIASAGRPQIFGNNIEVTGTCDAVTALVDIQGTSGDPISGASITGNTIIGVPTTTTYLIRLDYAISTRIEANNFGIGGSLIRAVNATANAVDTRIVFNHLFPEGTASTYLLTDASSSATVVSSDTSGTVTFGNSLSTTSKNKFNFRGALNQGATEVLKVSQTNPLGTADSDYTLFGVGGDGTVKVMNKVPTTGSTVFMVQAGAGQSTDLFQVLSNAGSPLFLVGPTGTTVMGSGLQFGFGTTTFASLGTVPTAGRAIYCTNCTTAATCASGGTGHLAVSNGTNWTCQ